MTAPVAQALLTNTYKLPATYYRPEIRMITIEIFSAENKPLLVLQAEHHPPAIENAIRSNGWDITLWDGNTLHLRYPVPTERTESSAELSHYVMSNGWLMVAMKIVNKEGQRISTLHSFDDPLSIEQTLRNNRWNLVERDGDTLRIAFIPMIPRVVNGIIPHIAGLNS